MGVLSRVDQESTNAATAGSSLTDKGMPELVGLDTRGGDERGISMREGDEDVKHGYEDRAAPDPPGDRWRYKVVYPGGVQVREAPSVAAPRTGVVLGLGTEFEASKSLSLDGVVYVRLADGTGWVFETKCMRDGESPIPIVELLEFQLWVGQGKGGQDGVAASSSFSSDDEEAPSGSSGRGGKNNQDPSLALGGPPVTLPTLPAGILAGGNSFTSSASSLSSFAGVGDSVSRRRRPPAPSRSSVSLIPASKGGVGGNSSSAFSSWSSVSAAASSSTEPHVFSTSRTVVPPPLPAVVFDTQSPINSSLSSSSSLVSPVPCAPTAMDPLSAASTGTGPDSASSVSTPPSRSKVWIDSATASGGRVASGESVEQLPSSPPAPVVAHRESNAFSWRRLQEQLLRCKGHRNVVDFLMSTEQQRLAHPFLSVDSRVPLPHSTVGAEKRLQEQLAALEKLVVMLELAGAAAVVDLHQLSDVLWVVARLGQRGNALVSKLSAEASDALQHKFGSDDVSAVAAVFTGVGGRADVLLDRIANATQHQLRDLMQAWIILSVETHGGGEVAAEAAAVPGPTLTQRPRRGRGGAEVAGSRSASTRPADEAATGQQQERPRHSFAEEMKLRLKRLLEDQNVQYAFSF
mmetsp:Transcript_329/g.1070  ORF Transcript_329/g.1070 Transcript_329/m.1070 type:complete len:633 (-) Transcript_329:174-2072(-)